MWIGGGYISVDDFQIDNDSRGMCVYYRRGQKNKCNKWLRRESDRMRDAQVEASDLIYIIISMKSNIDLSI